MQSLQSFLGKHRENAPQSVLIVVGDKNTKLTCLKRAPSLKNDPTIP